MVSRKVLQLHEAEKMVKAIQTAAAGDGGAPIVVAVCDDRGDLVELKRMDGAPLRSIAIAQNKAYSAARMLADTISVEANLKKAERSIRAFGDERLTDLPGGVVLRGPDGAVIGAIGISGRTVDEDHRLALLGKDAMALD